MLRAFLLLILALLAAPSAAQMLTCQVGLDTPVEEMERWLEESYVIGLEADRPVAT